MNFIVVFTIFIASLVSQNGAYAASCKTGNVTVAKDDELMKVFVLEYTSKSNFAWNAFTGNWFSHLTKIGDYALWDLCDCISSKYNGPIKNDSIIFSVDKTTIENAGLEFSFVDIKKSTPLVECVFNNHDFFIMEGYRSNGLRNTMDVYLLKMTGGLSTGGKHTVKFAALVQSVEIPRCRVCW